MCRNLRKEIDRVSEGDFSSWGNVFSGEEAEAKYAIDAPLKQIQ